MIDFVAGLIAAGLVMAITFAVTHSGQRRRPEERGNLPIGLGVKPDFTVPVKGSENLPKKDPHEVRRRWRQ
jgi:hypothetical protein